MNARGGWLDVYRTIFARFIEGLICFSRMAQEPERPRAVGEQVTEESNGV